MGGKRSRVCRVQYVPVQCQTEYTSRTYPWPCCHQFTILCRGHNS
ncbi:hypothetical protein E2C01_078443 [Portunus trituberculatus]|uniref:Uncharacterized protein n=1 Tax=Portunus trituberculatus TaxID=210409 RepID=A0A5B7IQ81_PORTR|nr:hypothetical protein [Portunus trituberculatus]